MNNSICKAWLNKHWQRGSPKTSK